MAFTMEWQAPDGEPTLYTVTAGNQAMLDMAAGNATPAAEHNGLVLRIAAAMDAVANPGRATWRPMVASVQAATPIDYSAVPYLTQMYHGPIVAAQGRAVPVLGAETPPADAAALRYWQAAAAMLRRFAGYTVSSAATANTTTGNVVVVAGLGADAVVPARGTGVPNSLIKEDVETGRAAGFFMSALANFAARRLLQAQLQIASPETSAETTAAPLITALQTEYTDSGTRALYWVGGGTLVGLALAAVLRASMKNSPWKGIAARV